MKALGRAAVFLALLSFLALLLISVPALAGPAAPPEVTVPEEIKSAPTAPAGDVADTVALALDILHQVMKFVVDNQALVIAFGVAVAGIYGTITQRRGRQASFSALVGTVSQVETLRTEVDEVPGKAHETPAERLSELTRIWKQGAPARAARALEAAVASIKNKNNWR